MRHMRQYSIATALFLFAFTVAGYAQIPATIGYQGVLADSSGGAVADGNYTMTLRIYEVAGGGTHVWEESQLVPVFDGYFNVMLGEAVPLGIPFDRPYWVGVAVNGAAEMIPRTPLSSVAYSLNPPSGAAGGDLNGSYPDPVVKRIRGRGVANVDPNSGDVLKWNGTQWSPAADDAGSPVWQQSGTYAYYNTGNVGIGTSKPDGGKLHIYHNGSLSNPQVRLHENGNDYARLNLTNNNSGNYWTIAGYIATNNKNDRLNFWNGTSGDVMTITGDGEVGIGVGISPKVDFHVGNQRMVLFGTDTLGAGDKLMFNPRLHAFRVGTLTATGATATYWNPDSIGTYSFASGVNTRAQGFGATAMGRDTEARNSYAMATGYFSNAIGAWSTAMGYNTDARGLASTALGSTTDADGDYSLALNRNTEADAYASTAIGRFNVGGGSATSWIGTDPIFEIGNGTGSASRSNAVTVLKNGNVGIGTSNPLDRFHLADGRLRFGSVEYLEDGGSDQITVRGTVRPSTDNSYDLGTSSFRWDDVYATNGTIITSDLRSKENIETTPYGLREVMRMRPIRFTRKGQPTRRHLGLSAQDLLNIAPEVVKTFDYEVDEETERLRRVELNTYGVYYAELIPILIRAIQEQQERIEALEAEVTRGRGR